MLSTHKFVTKIFLVFLSITIALSLSSAAAIPDPFSARILPENFEDIYFETTDRTPLYVRRYLVGLSAADVATYRAFISTNYPEAVELAPPTADYNCHTYAWLNQATSYDFWILYPNEFIADSHTLQLTESELQPGDIVVYYLVEDSNLGDYEPGEEPTDDDTLIIAHSAVVDEITGTDIICISKWGPYGLYRHSMEYVMENYMAYPSSGTCILGFYRYVHGQHSETYESLSATHHKIRCTQCDYPATQAVQPHTLTYTSTGSSSHTVSCTTCSFSETHSHSFTYQDKNARSHIRSCTLCSYTGTEAHTLDLSGKKCLKCGRIGNMAVNKTDPEEQTE